MIFKNEEGKWVYYSSAAGAEITLGEFIAAGALGLSVIGAPLLIKAILALFI